jgi:HAD superfamily hydrolase (TIGR01662 family)
MLVEVALRAVFFDVGETLVDETRLWGAWADALGIPWFTFMGVLGGLIERGEHHDRTFEVLKPGFEPLLENETFDLDDFYPDAVPCLRRLREAGYLVGVAGNQSARLEDVMRSLDLPIDVIASSASLEVEKPSPSFFERLAARAGIDPKESAYVGDRMDNDVLPAREAGMHGVFLKRGPWAYLHAHDVASRRPDVKIESLDELPDALAGL